MRRITEWLTPGDMCKSSYGNITNAMWVEKEKDRLNKDNGEEAYYTKEGIYNGVCLVTSLKRN